MFPKGYKLRRFQDKNEKSVKKLVWSVLREHGFPPKPELDRDLDAIKEIYGDGFFILEKDKKIVGTIGTKSINDKEAELKRLYLVPEERGRGLGSKLFDVAINFAREKGFKKVKLDSHIRLEKARELYERKGCKLIKQEGNMLFYELEL